MNAQHPLQTNAPIQHLRKRQRVLSCWLVIHLCHLLAACNSSGPAAPSGAPHTDPSAAKPISDPQSTAEEGRQAHPMDTRAAAGHESVALELTLHHLRGTQRRDAIAALTALLEQSRHLPEGVEPIVRHLGSRLSEAPLDQVPDELLVGAWRVARQHPAFGARRLALFIVTRSTLRPPLDEIERFLADPHHEVRQEAAETLAILDLPGAGAALERVLRDPDLAVQRAAIRGLCRLGYKDAIPSLVELAGSALDAELEKAAWDTVERLSGVRNLPRDRVVWRKWINHNIIDRADER